MCNRDNILGKVNIKSASCEEVFDCLYTKAMTHNHVTPDIALIEIKFSYT